MASPDISTVPPSELDATVDTTIATDSHTIVVNEVVDELAIGKVIGQCKWFNDKLGYGFITVQSQPEKGKDIFVHHSGIKPLNSNYRTLRKGEYVNFDIVTGDNGPQGVNVSGIGGGSLMCDVVFSSRFIQGVNNPNFQGSQGSQGSQGCQGIQGIQGIQGSQNNHYPPPPPMTPNPYMHNMMGHHQPMMQPPMMHHGGGRGGPRQSGRGGRGGRF